MKKDVQILRVGTWMIFWCLFALWLGATAIAEPVSSGTDKATVQVYGQVDRAILYADDGNTGALYQVDNDNSSTRVGLNGKAKGEGLTVGSKFEVELQSNASNEVSQEEPNTDDGDTHFGIRYADLFFQFDKIGTISLGQGDTASNGASEVDLSGTGIIGYSGTSDLAGGIFFYNNDVDAISDTKVGDVISNLDGNSRKDRLRYDSPTVSGLGVAVSTFSDQNTDSEGKSAYDAAIRYSGKAGDVAIAAAIAYSTYPSDQKAGKERLVNGSASVAFSGFSITLAAGNENLDDDTNDSKNFYYGKVGYAMEFWNIGQTALAIDYGQYNDIETKEDEAKTVGLMFVQKLEDWSTEIYAGFRKHNLDREGADYDAVSAMMIGARIKF